MCKYVRCILRPWTRGSSRQLLIYTIEMRCFFLVILSYWWSVYTNFKLHCSWCLTDNKMSLTLGSLVVAVFHVTPKNQSHLCCCGRSLECSVGYSHMCKQHHMWHLQTCLISALIGQYQGVMMRHSIVLANYSKDSKDIVSFYNMKDDWSRREYFSQKYWIN